MDNQLVYLLQPQKYFVSLYIQLSYIKHCILHYIFPGSAVTLQLLPELYIRYCIKFQYTGTCTEHSLYEKHLYTCLLIKLYILINFVMWQQHNADIYPKLQVVFTSLIRMRKIWIFVTVALVMVPYLSLDFHTQQSQGFTQNDVEKNR